MKRDGMRRCRSAPGRRKMKTSWDENRMAELAQHKTLKSIWGPGENGRNMQWGNQDPIWPVREATQTHEPSPRLITLAQQKKNFSKGERLPYSEFTYSCGRSSVLWKVKPAALNAEASARVEQLAKHKQAPKGFFDKVDRDAFVFGCGRSSPIWKVDDKSKSADATPRVEDLSRPKPTHNFQPARTVHTVIPKAALRAKSSDRIETLSSPRNRSDYPHRDPQWQVTSGAKSSVPTARLTELAKSKAVPDSYQPPREIIRPISWSTKNAVCSTRLGEISQPILRASMDLVQFNPKAFEVKDTALKARCSNRLLELAEPIKR